MKPALPRVIATVFLGLFVASSALAAAPSVKKLKLGSVAEMATAYKKLNVAAGRVARRQLSASRFRDATVMLVAADRARKADNLDVAKRLARQSSATIAGGGTSIKELKKKRELSSWLTRAHGDLPGRNGMLVGAAWARLFELKR